MDEPTPNDLLNEAAKQLGLIARVDHNSGVLHRDRTIALLILEIAKRVNRSVLSLPRKK